MSVNPSGMRVGFAGSMGAPSQQNISSSSGNNLQQNQQQSSVNNNSNANNNSSGVGVPGVGGGGVPGGGGVESPQQMNTLSFCKVGAETVQDIVARTIELFSMLKTLQLPNGTANGNQLSVENKVRIQENINRTRHLFKRLHIIFARVNEDCGGMDYTPIESLVPYRDDVESRPDLKKKSDKYRHCAEEVIELKEQLCLRSRYQKDIIDQLRKIIWEINTMLAVRANT